MRIATGHLFLAPAVFIQIIEMICSEPTTMEDLFPDYNCIMPLAEYLKYAKQFPNFETFGDKSLQHKSMTLFKRDHIMFGWTYGSFVIVSDLCTLFPDLENVSIAYDINKKKWITLPRALSEALGSGRDYRLIVARDRVAAVHFTTSSNPVYKQAHIRACKEANDQASSVELIQKNLLDKDEITLKNARLVIMEEYSEAYNRAFMLYLNLHGETNIHGYRKMQPLKGIFNHVMSKKEIKRRNALNAKKKESMQT